MRSLLYLLLITTLMVGCNNTEAPPTAPPDSVVVEITATSVPTAISAPMPTEKPIPTTTSIAEIASSTANAASLSPAISADGRYIVFLSTADDLIPIPPQAGCDIEGDGSPDEKCINIYRYDRETDELTLITQGPQDTAANGFSIFASISNDGRYIGFVSTATNLVPEQEVFCQQQGQGACGNIYLYDHDTQQITWITKPFADKYPDAFSLFPHIAPNGRAIVYYSSAGNLVPNDTNGMGDVFLYEIETETTRILSLSPEGEPAQETSYAPSISSNGQYVSFSSTADNLVPNDTNGIGDVFVHEVETGINTRVSVTSDGAEGNNFSEFSTISGDGRYVVFESVATNFDSRDTNFLCDLDSDDTFTENCRDIFLHDRATGITTLISLISTGGQISSPSFSGVISDNGEAVVYSTAGPGLARGDTNGAYDVFVRNLTTNETTLVSVASDGTKGNHNSGFTSNPQLFPRDTFDLSEDGRFVVFNSSAGTFVANDLNNGEDCEPSTITGGFDPQCSDIFLHDRETGETILISSPRKER